MVKVGLKFESFKFIFESFKNFFATFKIKRDTATRQIGYAGATKMAMKDTFLRYALHRNYFAPCGQITLHRIT